MSRIERLLGEMSLAEKIGQLTMTAAQFAVTGPVQGRDAADSVRAGAAGMVLNLIGAERLRELQRIAVEESRLGIPLIFALDVVHGYRTLHPMPAIEAGLFDPQTWEQSAREAAREAAAEGIAMTFAPMLDVARDPRWGRGAEGPGEDPWLASRYAEAKVRGFQGGDLANADSIAAVAKHFCAYGAVTAGLDYAPVDVSLRALHEVYLPPFAAAVNAGVAAIMPAFTDLAGIPMSAHRDLIQGWLRGAQKFDGLVVSDYNAVAELIRHGVAADLAQAAALALGAGVDVDMMSDAYRLGLPEALERGWASIEDVDAAVRRVLRLKQRLGLFEDPYRRGRSAPSAGEGAARRRFARSLAGRALVMLKNEGALPVAPGAAHLAVVGPLAAAAAEMSGPWWAAAAREDQVSVLAGLEAAFGGACTAYAQGVAIEGEDVSGIAGALALCERADAIVLCLGESALMSGEAASRAGPDLPGAQRTLALAVLERARSLRTRVIAVLFGGRPLIVPWLIERADAVLAAGFLGSEAGHAVADVISGRVSPQGRLTMTWPRAVGQIPIFFGQRPGGRPADSTDPMTSRYLDVARSPLFAFGAGEGYGRFSLRNLQVPAGAVSRAETLVVQVDVVNEGSTAAVETVLLFTHDVQASVARPLLELKGFGRIRLEPGDRGTLTLRVSASELAFPGADLQPVFEPGEVEILVGPVAERSRLLAARIQLRA